MQHATLEGVGRATSAYFVRFSHTKQWCHLVDSNSSAISKRLAASVVSQSSTSKQTGADLEAVASKVLQSSKYSDDTKQLAASVLSQSNKER